MPPRFKNDRPLGKHKIKAWREHRGLTQQAVADRIGTSKPTISRVERSVVPYTQDLLEALADLLLTSPQDLLAKDPEEVVADQKRKKGGKRAPGERPRP